MFGNVQVMVIDTGWPLCFHLPQIYPAMSANRAGVPRAGSGTPHAEYYMYIRWHVRAVRDVKDVE